MSYLKNKYRLDGWFNQSLIEHGNTNYQALAVISRALGKSGYDTELLNEKLLAATYDQDTAAKAYALLATADTNLAAELAAGQEGDGSWEGSVFTTALAAYALLETGFEYSRAQQGLYYLRLNQNTDGGWGEEGSTALNTSVALSALVKGGFTGDSAERAVNHLLRRRGGDGDWGNNASTAWAVLALQAMGPAEIDKTVQLWETTINIDNGWGIYAGTESDPFVSALVILALQDYDESHPTVGKGLAYLQEQVEEEVWVEKASAFYRLTEILYLLQEDPRFSALRSNYQQWLLDFPEQENFDYTARKISLLSTVGGEITEELQKLPQGRNPDGGWGFSTGYESSPWDTALVLRALLDAGYEDLSVYQGITAFLNARRNYDGSFSLKKNDDGHLYLTALLVKELERLNNFLDCSHLLVPAKQRLVSQRDHTGAYGGSMLETALGFRVTLDLLTPTQLNATVNLIESAMLSNGSWENDPVTTAAVLAALGGLAPDLRVTMDEILFSPPEPYLRDRVEITVTVRNSGFAPAENVEVRLYHEEDGDAVPDRLFAGNPCGAGRYRLFYLGTQ